MKLKTTAENVRANIKILTRKIISTTQLIGSHEKKVYILNFVGDHSNETFGTYYVRVWFFLNNIL